MVGQFRKKITSLGEEFGLDLLAKELINSTIKSAGKSKDELVQILGREIGLAWAAVLKEPIEDLLNGKSLQITVELVSKDEGDEELTDDSNSASKKKKVSKKVKKKSNKKKSTTPSESHDTDKNG